MSQLPKIKSRRIPRILLAALVGGFTAAAVAETVVVHRPVSILSEKETLSPATEKVPLNTKLEVLDRDGPWVHVRTPAGNEGYISKRDAAGEANLKSVSGSGTASGADASLAGRGLDEKAEEYARGKNLSSGDANLAIDWGDAIAGEDLVAFMKQGHVGPKKFRN